MKRVYSRCMWHFDRIFGNNRNIGWQIVIILGLVGTLVAFVGLLGWLMLSLGFDSGDKIDSPLIQSIGLVFGASNLPPAELQTFPLWWQTVAVLLGAVLFSGVTITFVGNLLGNRQEAYRSGTVRYWFKNHLLFLGGSRIILPMIKAVAEDATHSRRDIVVLTGCDIAQVRTDIDRALSDKALRRMKITVLNGDHYDSEMLASVHVDKAAQLYIVGDLLSDTEHDSENVACWEAAKELCAQRTEVPCRLYFSRSSSAQLFRRRQEDNNNCLDTTIINWPESVAQRVLVSDGANTDYPALDRDGIGYDDHRAVHLVLNGMTSISFAMATTAAHLCHFPNSIDPSTWNCVPERRTKITFVAPDIKAEMHFMTSHLASLFKLSNYTYISEREEVRHAPDPRYGDFLDVEWEFVDGSMADDWVIERMKGYYRRSVVEEKSYLTVAMCDLLADRNIAAALYLPNEFHHIVRRDDGSVDYTRTIPLLVYQPDNEVLVRHAKRNAPIYANLFPFGSECECYDASINRRIEEGKRINYIYCCGHDYKQMTEDQMRLNAAWKPWGKLGYEKQMSSIYSANQLSVKLRSVGMDRISLLHGGQIPEHYADMLAVVEHNRWNMERLLMCYDAVEQSRRQHLKQLEQSGNAAEMEAEKKALKDFQLEYQQHYCIAPYSELLESSREFNRLIVSKLPDVLKV